jgi:hypothetical protein
MITDIDESGRKTYNSALLGTVGQLVASIGLVYTGTISPYYLPLGVFYC